MNAANEILQAIRNKKAILTKEKNESIQYIEEQYRKDMEILNKEEKEWLSQFKDVPLECIKED